MKRSDGDEYVINCLDSYLSSWDYADDTYLLSLKFDGTNYNWVDSQAFGMVGDTGRCLGVRVDGDETDDVFVLFIYDSPEYGVEK
jgi:hypothetical protein